VNDVIQFQDRPTRRGPRRRKGSATIGLHTKTYCPVSGKVRFRDHQQAAEALEAARWQRDWELATFATSGRAETRAYRCSEPACNGGWHLTSIRVWRGDAA